MLTEKQLLELKILILYHEACCEFGKATKPEVIKMNSEITTLFLKYNLEKCAHNYAILGSERYARYKIPDYDYLLTCSDYANRVKNKQTIAVYDTQYKTDFDKCRIYSDDFISRSYVLIQKMRELQTQLSKISGES